MAVDSVGSSSDSKSSAGSPVAHGQIQAAPATQATVKKAADVSASVAKSTASVTTDEAGPERTSSAQSKVTPALVKPTVTPAAVKHEAASKPSVKPTNSQWGTRVITGTTVLEPGQSVASNRMRITMGTDGNLMISDENGVVRWSSHTEGTGSKAVFQNDGNFVVYTKDGKSAWSSHTNGHDGARLVIQNDGNVAIYTVDGAALWSAGTQH
ncbi:hypothetical protein ABZ379_43060 [Streptomyces canus]|uniref:hypothetical protein n=1 Tax=Streptomyces canus TaxID=58343 RepID=UPI0033ED41C6